MSEGEHQNNGDTLGIFYDPMAARTRRQYSNQAERGQFREPGTRRPRRPTESETRAQALAQVALDLERLMRTMLG